MRTHSPVDLRFRAELAMLLGRHMGTVENMTRAEAADLHAEALDALTLALGGWCAFAARAHKPTI